MSFLIKSKPQPTFGSSLATGLGDALAHLANGKVESYRKHQHTKDLLKSGIPKEYAQLIPHLDENGAKSFWNSFNFNKLVPSQHGEQQEGEMPEEEWSQAYRNNSFEQELKREKFEEQKRVAAEKEQAAIDKQYSARLADYEKYDKIGAQLENIAEEAYQIVNELEEEGGGVNPLAEGAIQGIKTGSLGGIDLGSLVGEKAERLRSLYSQLVTEKTALLKGQPSNFKVKLLQETKPSLTQSPQAQKALLESVMREAQSLRAPQQEALKILDQHEGRLPRNFNQLIDPLIKQRHNEIYQRSEGQQVTDKSILKELGAPSRIKEGKGIEDEETGIVYFVKNGKWFMKG
jgi:hypothetical protein